MVNPRTSSPSTSSPSTSSERAGSRNGRVAFTGMRGPARSGGFVRRRAANCLLPCGSV